MTSPAPVFPGIYFNENLAPPPTANGTAISSPCLVGAVNRGPIGGPAQINSWADWVALFGDFSPTATPSPLSLAAYSLLQQGGRPLYAIRVVDGTEVLAHVTLNDREGTPKISLTAKANNPGAWGNNLAISWQDTSTDSDGTPRGTFGIWLSGVLMERYLSISMDPNDTRYVVDQVNSKSNLAVLTDVSDDAFDLAQRTPAQTGTISGETLTLVPASLASGADGGVPVAANWTTATGLLDSIVAPLDINLVGQTGATFIDPALEYAENRGDSFIVIDSHAGDTSTAAVALAAIYQGNNGPTSYGAVYWPRVVIADPSRSSASAATLTIGAGGPVLGQYCLNDVNAGPQKAPAGYGTSLVGVIGVETAASSADLATCQSSVPAINALRLIPGSGVCIMGARTLQTLGTADKFINVRRSLIYIKASIALVTRIYLFDDNDQTLWSEISAAAGAWLTAFWQARGLVGSTADDAYFVTCDATTNTELTIDNGETITQIGVALQKPSEFLIFNISQIESTATVTEVAA